MSRIPMSQKTVLLTGASKGLGFAVTRQLLSLGARVIAVARDTSPLDDLSDYGSGQLTPIAADISDPQGLAKALSGIESIDVLVLNAGTCEYIAAKNFDSALFSRVSNVNLQGNANLLELTIPYLIESEKEPQIVGISSLVTELPLPRSEAYGASKAGFDYLLNSLRTDLYRYGVDVTVIKPGFIKTPLTDQNDFDMPFIMEAEQASEHVLKAILQRRYCYRFPWQLSLPMKLLSWLPQGALTRTLQKMVQKRS